MPIATRRRVLARDQEPQYAESTSGDDNELGDASRTLSDRSGEEEEFEDEDLEYEEELEEAQVGTETEDPSHPPNGLKEISSLASWTVSTAKPGSGVAALRHPSTAHFWQSDGPQPHLLSIHFFKLVSIVHMRIFLDFENDESYTPTKIQFLAGMGVHDVQEFAEMQFEQPTGWIDVDFSTVGPIETGEDEHNQQHRLNEVDWSKRPVLRAFLVQVRILENHQNGKDTHLRAVQIFARDESQSMRLHEKSALPAEQASKTLAVRERTKHIDRKETNNIKLASWMLDPDLR